MLVRPPGHPPDPSPTQPTLPRSVATPPFSSFYRLRRRSRPPLSLALFAFIPVHLRLGLLRKRSQRIGPLCSCQVVKLPLPLDLPKRTSQDPITWPSSAHHSPTFSLLLCILRFDVASISILTYFTHYITTSCTHICIERRHLVFSYCGDPTWVDASFSTSLNLFPNFFEPPFKSCSSDCGLFKREDLERRDTRDMTAAASPDPKLSFPFSIFSLSLSLRANENDICIAKMFSNFTLNLEFEWRLQKYSVQICL